MSFSRISSKPRLLSTTRTLAAELNSLIAMKAITDAQHRVEDAYERVRLEEVVYRTV